MRRIFLILILLAGICAAPAECAAQASKVVKTAVKASKTAAKASTKAAQKAAKSATANPGTVSKMMREAAARAAAAEGSAVVPASGLQTRVPALKSVEPYTGRQVAVGDDARRSRRNDGPDIPDTVATAADTVVVSTYPRALRTAQLSAAQFDALASDSVLVIVDAYAAAVDSIAVEEPDSVAATVYLPELSAGTIVADTVVARHVIVADSDSTFAPVVVEKAGKQGITTHFAWGADAGASIDMTGNDMSAVEFSAFFGMRRGWINFLGVGAEADIVTSNSCRSYPLFVDFRTNFVNRPTLFFWGLRLGVSLNYMQNNWHQAGAYGLTGVGINLARSSKFCSHIFVGYTFRERRTPDAEGAPKMPNLHYATFKLGVTF